MPGLLRGMARTAVVAGTATTVSNRVSRRQANKWAREDAPAPEPQYAPPPAAPPAAPAESRIDKLTKLGKLKAQGVLTDEEFAQEKARILNS
jgi:hypothetical protein